jgi:hypothetical protein
MPKCGVRGEPTEKEDIYFRSIIFWLVGHNSYFKGDTGDY